MGKVAMDIDQLKYIKNVSADSGWAYSDYVAGSYFQLNFKEGPGVDTHALNLRKESLIILSQRPQKPSIPDERYLTHVVELVNEGNEDKPQWMKGTWGIFRWAKVHWAADLSGHNRIPVDEAVMKVDWGKHNTKAKSLAGPNLMSEWSTIEALRKHLGKEFASHLPVEV